ncbi:hypothetical protein F511_47643 [Dorcoceras hygrometricum]|uniref:Chromo domain-containing protein n=1 Tax=Dorcoceras hygrometricum TaxID=472368 RepID=A0A2Z6ZQK1_9LAMI|nr:hypothetical protein F511_47643 [Dorcoceras hygrometricum]
MANLYEPSKILAHRQKKQVGVMVPQVLVQWKNKPIEEATWEDEAEFAAQFPDTSLGDKADFKEGGVVRSSVNKQNRPRPNITKVYSRRATAQRKE